MRNYTKQFIFVGGTALILIFSVSCIKKNDSQYDNYIREAITSNVKGLDPVVSGDVYSSLVMQQIYQGSMQYSYLARPVRPHEQVMQD